MANAKRDDNRITTLIGASSSDGVTPINVYVDPITHRLLVDNAGGSSSLTVTDGITTVTNVATLDFTSGAIVSNGGGGIANVAISGGGGTPASPNTSVQFNDGGNFGGDATFTFDKTAKVLTVQDISGVAGSDLQITTPNNDTNDIYILAGNGISSGASGGEIHIISGNATAGDTNGAPNSWIAGNGHGAGTGGYAIMEGGDAQGGSIGQGGEARVWGGNAGSGGSSKGGDVVLASGTNGGGGGSPGDIVFDTAKTGTNRVLTDTLLVTGLQRQQFPNKTGVFALFDVYTNTDETFTAQPPATTSSNGVNITLNAGVGGTVTGNGGNFTIFAGSAGTGSNGNGGNLQIEAGFHDGSGTSGSVDLYNGDENAHLHLGTDNFHINTPGSGASVILDSSLMTSDKTYEFPDKSGTFALLSDLPSGTLVIGEIPSGTIDDSNTTFTLAHTPIGNIAVYVNRLRMNLTSDYTLSTATITLTNPVGSGGSIVCDYQH